jgi:riboflavin kinase/FMN adenylyltransferase
MDVVEGLNGLRSVGAGGVVSVGNFDGVHLGHREILVRARDLAAKAGGELVVVTFEPHPLTVLAPGKAPARLTPVGLKRELLERAGVDRVVELAPTREVLDLSAEAFWAILRDELRPRHMVEGISFNFGKGRGGTIQKLAEWAAGSPVQLHVVPPVEVALLDLTVAAVSSSLIRWLLANGRARDAGIGLGRAYVLEGRVVKGYGRGKKLGIPTANLDCGGQMIPMEGVYAGRCTVDCVEYPAAVSVGRMETFGKGLGLAVEAHLMGFNGDLYDRVMRVELVDWVRAQRKFSGVDELKDRIARDLVEVEQRMGMESGKAIATVGL